MKMTISLFDSIINTSQDCVFWKDKDRRFLGVNQAFLDYYGFESEEELIGKNDEDMGWHNDPEPFKQDELRVLGGESTYKVQGKCMVHGEERDIIASKRPLYEGDEIVGLVGSFIDITDIVRRQKMSDERQIIYTVEKLRKIPYWDKLLDSTALDEILDPLTGVITRNYMMDFADSLILQDKPFSMSILDLDNFKLINDRYGHHSGDIVLKDVTASLAAYTDGYGLIGRFGGDELLLINLKDTEHEDNSKFWSALYASGKVFRKEVEVENASVFITCTSGTASCPADSGNLTELFSMIDTALYIGKNRGRNCFTVYDDDKHRNIDMRQIVKHNLCSDMSYLKKHVVNSEDTSKALLDVMPFLKEALQIRDVYYIDEQGYLRAVLEKELKKNAQDAGNVIGDEPVICNSVRDIEKDSPLFCKALQEIELASFIGVEFKADTDKTLYLIFASNRKHRIWQENDRVLCFFLASILGMTPGRSL
ncbi:MAG: sensor domain-containing diguanylate cyclase [Lachnospiraceae bacterium]|nr:sensor domain-containing diguanylate cyclase [Lachnospiraceae bacterium]